MAAMKTGPQVSNAAARDRVDMREKHHFDTHVIVFLLFVHDALLV